MLAAAEITFVLAGLVGVAGVTGVPSALRFLDSLDMGLMSCDERVSVFE